MASRSDVRVQIGALIQKLNGLNFTLTNKAAWSSLDFQGMEVGNSDAYLDNLLNGLEGIEDSICNLARGKSVKED